MMQAAIAVNKYKLSEKLPKDDKRWQSFNNSFENRLLDPTDFASEVYTGHAYTSWHNPSLRNSDNWEQSQFLAVDMDTEDDRSTLDMLMQHDLVACYGTVLHTTPSHTKELPRARVVFFLDRPILSPAAYNSASTFLSMLLGGDPKATDPSRFFYGSLHAEMRLPSHTMPVDYLRLLYKRYQRHTAEMYREDKRQSASAPHHRNTVRHENQAPEPDKMEKDIRAALDKINPWDIDYKDWCAIVGAIKYELGDSGLQVAINWADGKEGEIERMWRSLRRQAGSVATVGTIFHWAYPQRA